jgi:hypothetical protein
MVKIGSHFLRVNVPDERTLRATAESDNEIWIL